MSSSTHYDGGCGCILIILLIILFFNIGKDSNNNPEENQSNYTESSGSDSGSKNPFKTISKGFKRTIDFIDKNVAPDPPIGITFRDGFISNGVIQIHSTTDKQIVCRIKVANENKNQQTSFKFALPPNESKEFGVLEMGWSFDNGEYGCVEVEGYEKSVFFKLDEDGYHYRTWIQ